MGARDMSRKVSYRARSTPFVVESNTWADWSEERQFNTYKEALEWGRENLPQNEWRIKNTISGRVVYKYDYTHVLTDFARTDVNRINEHQVRMREWFSGEEERERWRQRQRQRQREREQPVMPINAWANPFLGDTLPNLWDDGIGLWDDGIRDKVDWQHEGF